MLCYLPPEYIGTLPPEIWCKEDTDQSKGATLGGPNHLSDMYGLGATFWRLLAGRRMFSGTLRVILSSITSREPPSLQFVRPDIPTVISKIVQKLLSKNPDERYARSVPQLIQTISVLTRPAAQAGSRKTLSNATEILVRVGHPKQGLWSLSKTFRLRGPTTTQYSTYMANCSVGNRSQSLSNAGFASLRRSTSVDSPRSGLNMAL
jgi:serine/threonine protein kinase